MFPHFSEKHNCLTIQLSIIRYSAGFLSHSRKTWESNAPKLMVIRWALLTCVGNNQLSCLSKRVADRLRMSRDKMTVFPALVIHRWLTLCQLRFSRRRHLQTVSRSLTCRRRKLPRRVTSASRWNNNCWYSLNGPSSYPASANCRLMTRYYWWSIFRSMFCTSAVTDARLPCECDRKFCTRRESIKTRLSCLKVMATRSLSSPWHSKRWKRGLDFNEAMWFSHVMFQALESASGADWAPFHLLSGGNYNFSFVLLRYFDFET